MKQKGVSGKMAAWVSTHKAGVLFGLAFAAAMAVVFARACSPWVAITSPDDAPFYTQNHLVVMSEMLLSGSVAFTPFFLGNLFAPVGLHEARYVVSVLLFALSGAYYLRTLRVDAWAAFGGGLLLALSGYTFTLFAAGHMGFFWLMGGFFWTFGLLNRCLGSGRPHHFLLLGAAPMWAFPAQPDVGVLFAAVFACYALWRLWLARRQLRQTWPKFLLTALAAGLIGLPGVNAVLTQHLAGRDKQIESVMRPAAEKGADTSRKHTAERWDFATGWSLPPSDCVEFFIPGFFGDASFYPPYPFWGKLGSVPEEQRHQAPYPNYRQHTVYLGLVTLMLAVVGTLAWWGRRREAAAGPPGGEADLRDVPFWCVVAAVALVLAMGRYTPLYRLFYALPYMDYLRAPVKFLHFTELAVGLLAGFGLHALLGRERVTDRFARNVFFIAIGVAAACVAATLAAMAGKGAMEEQIAGLGLKPFAPALSSYAVYNCVRAVGLAVAVAGLVYCWKTRKWIRVPVAVCGLVLLGAGDLAMVARRYVATQNVKAAHTGNVIVKAILQKTAGQPVNIMRSVRQPPNPDGLGRSLRFHGIRNVFPDGTDTHVKEIPVFMALQNNPDPARLWDALGVRFILAPRQQAERMVQQRLAVPVGEYELGGESVVLVERQAVALPCVHFDWDGDVPADRQAERLAQSGRAVVTDAPAPAAPAPAPAQAVAFAQMRGMRNVFTSRAELDLPQPGLLVWNEPYAPGLVAAIDGRQVPLHQANGVWCAVRVPAGRHTVTCRIRAGGGRLNLVAATASLGVALAAGLAWLRGKRAEK